MRRTGAFSVEWGQLDRASQALTWKRAGASLAGVIAGRTEEVGGVATLKIALRTFTSPIEGSQSTCAC